MIHQSTLPRTLLLMITVNTGGDINHLKSHVKFLLYRGKSFLQVSHLYCICFFKFPLHTPLLSPVAAVIRDIHLVTLSIFLFSSINNTIDCHFKSLVRYTRRQVNVYHLHHSMWSPRLFSLSLTHSPRASNLHGRDRMFYSHWNKWTLQIHFIQQRWMNVNVGPSTLWTDARDTSLERGRERERQRMKEQVQNTQVVLSVSRDDNKLN